MKSLLVLAAVLLSSPSLFAAADLSINTPLTTGTVHAGSTLNVFYQVHNSGPDKATNVVVTFTVSGAIASASPSCSAGCPINDIASGQYGGLVEQLTFPDEAGVATMTASVSSAVADPNLADNSQTSTLTISTDPDVGIAIEAGSPLDLGVPFPLSIFLGNASRSAAHDVNVTVDFPADVAVRALPAGCANPTAGRIICTLDTLRPGGAAQPAFVATLVAPSTYGTGSITFTATATERENDFAPATNTTKISLQLYNTIYVTTAANDGSGSLRQAILDVNANCANRPLCTIGFRIEESSANTWKTITITSPLPALTAPDIRVNGGTQTGLLGDTNPDGPEIEISGGGTVDGDGLLVASCGAEIANLTVNGFLRNGISVSRPPCSPYVGAELHHLFLGTDPSGSYARPNTQRGIGIAVPNGTNFGTTTGAISIHANVISGNTLSGIFDLAGRVNIYGNRIGVKAHSDEPLPNGASGIFIGPGGFGSAIGFDFLSRTNPGNVIAFNKEMGIAVAPGIFDVSILGNRIWSNGLLGIDIGLDGPTSTTRADSNEVLTAPTLTLAHYDPVSKHTIVEADIPTGGTISFFANDSADPSGYGEGQRPLGDTSLAPFLKGAHFHFEADGDLTGQFITATSTRVNYIGFAKPGGVNAEGIEQGFLTQTSEFSRAIEVR